MYFLKLLCSLNVDPTRREHVWPLTCCGKKQVNHNQILFLVPGGPQGCVPCKSELNVCTELIRVCVHRCVKESPNESKGRDVRPGCRSDIMGIVCACLCLCAREAWEPFACVYRRETSTSAEQWVKFSLPSILRSNCLWLRYEHIHGHAHTQRLTSELPTVCPGRVPRLRSLSTYSPKNEAYFCAESMSVCKSHFY